MHLDVFQASQTLSVQLLTLPFNTNINRIVTLVRLLQWQYVEIKFIIRGKRMNLRLSCQTEITAIVSSKNNYRLEFQRKLATIEIIKYNFSFFFFP